MADDVALGIVKVAHDIAALGRQVVDDLALVLATRNPERRIGDGLALEFIDEFQ
jgi:hypothetical protein